VLGNRLATMADRVQLPFTEATMMECQRLGNIALFNVPRCTTADTIVNGYHVPRGTWVFANRWGVHSSTRYWKNPSEFDPTRFIDERGRIIRHEALVPFGMGKDHVDELPFDMIKQ
jgi:cytochrome P450